MYSVWPEKARPERVTASLLSGAVTMASASPVEAHVGGEGDVGGGGFAVFGAELAEVDGFVGGEDVEVFESYVVERAEEDAGGLFGGFDGGLVAEEGPAGGVAQFGRGEGFEGDFGAYAGGVAEGYDDVRRSHAGCS